VRAIRRNNRTARTAPMRRRRSSSTVAARLTGALQDATHDGAELMLGVGEG
jgi:hypothetical protein